MLIFWNWESWYVAFLELKMLIYCHFGIENFDILQFWNWKCWYVAILEENCVAAGRKWVCLTWAERRLIKHKQATTPNDAICFLQHKNGASHISQKHKHKHTKTQTQGRDSKWCHLFSSAKKWWQLCQSYVHFNIDTLPVDNFIQHLYKTQGDVLTILEVNLLGYPLHDNVPIPRIFKMACTNDYASSTFRTWPLGPE